jgi:hypothetical protein
MKTSGKRSKGKLVLPSAFRRRWLELTGQPLSRGARLSPVLVSSIATLKAGGAAPLGLANPDIQVFVRRVQGNGCSKVAEIAGWYDMNLAPNLPCIGPVAVKAILDALATNICCKTLQCPTRCPCHYIPQAKLAFYNCAPGNREVGFLLQGNQAWNCECLEPPTV